MRPPRPLAILRITPFQNGDAYMGVEVHANIIDNLLHSGEAGRSFLTRGAREEMIDIGFILLFGIGMGVWFARVKPLVFDRRVAACAGGVRVVRVLLL